MARGSAALDGTNKNKDSRPTDGVSQIGGRRPGRHVPLSPIRNRHNHYQRQVGVS